jgi:asparagine synthase (glutamine-hydrolysing)
MLDGQGGDEVNLGYPRVAQLVMWEHLKRGNVSRFLKEWSGFSKNANTPKWKSLAWYIYFNTAFLAHNRKLATVGKWVDRDFLNSYDRKVAHDIYEPCSVYDRQFKELKYYILPRLLRFADRNSMAFSVESRVPHLAQPLLDFVLSTRFDYRVRGGYTKYLERCSMKGKMPDEVLWNPIKRGFAVPQSYWIDKLSPTIQKWIEELPEDTPFKKDNILKDLKGRTKKSPYFWRTVSAISLVHLLDYRF